MYIILQLLQECINSTSRFLFAATVLFEIAIGGAVDVRSDRWLKFKRNACGVGAYPFYSRKYVSYCDGEQLRKKTKLHLRPARYNMITHLHASRPGRSRWNFFFPRKTYFNQLTVGRLLNVLRTKRAVPNELNDCASDFDGGAGIGKTVSTLYHCIHRVIFFQQCSPPSMAVNILESHFFFY